MYKKSLSFFMCLVIVFSVFTVIPVNVSARQTNDFKYDIWTDGTAKVTQYIGNDLDVVIPSSLGGYKVTIIGKHAFYEQNIHSVSIPDSVRIIEEEAFLRCNGLVNVDLDYNYFTHEGVEIIGSNAFTITGTTSVGLKDRNRNEAFNDVFIPPSVKTIGICAFGYRYLAWKSSYSSYDEWYHDYYEMTITGYNNTAAQSYANGNPAIEFKSLGDVPSNPTEPPTDPPVKSISECSITLSPTEFTYDGTEKKPTVTVKDGSTVMSYGKDYTLAFFNNKEAGTAFVIVIGIGSYTGNVTKDFTIKAPVGNSLTDCTVTLGQTSYTYDGTKKEPTVTVKHGAKVLKEGTDYTVTYSNNIKVGTATANITGIGSYTGSVTKQFTIVDTKTEFIWGQDNWNFLNSSANGYFKDSTYREQINTGYLNTLKDNLTNTEYQIINGGYYCNYSWLDEDWGGSCYGMSSLALLSKLGMLPYTDYKPGATKLHDLKYPKSDSNVSSLVTYYQMLQIKDVIQQQYRTVPYRSHETNIKEIISLLDNNPTVLVCFDKYGWGGHAILATGYEYGSYTWSGVTYQGCIKICDPNCSMEYDKKYNIYFNTQSYNWTIPAYSVITSANGAEFSYVGANAAEINEGGYLNGSSGNKTGEFVARIDADKIANNRSVTKVKKSNGSYVNMATAPGDIIEDYSYVFGGESKGKVGYNIYDSSASYRVTQDNAQELQLGMDYQLCNLYGGSKAGQSVLFDPSGYVEINGETASYNMAITFDEDYPTDWFNIEVSGDGAKTASLQKAQNGYILKSDSLENVLISVNNKDDFASLSFSTDYNAVFIYEINKNTVGALVDTDNDGTYDTDLFETHGINGMILGDADGDGEVTIIDATAIQRKLASMTTAKFIKVAADADEDGDITILDATAIQRWLVQLHSNENIGKPLS